MVHPPDSVGSGRLRRLLAHVLFLFQSPDGSGDVDGLDPASTGGRIPVPVRQIQPKIHLTKITCLTLIV